LGTQKTDAQVAEQAQKSITGKVVDENGVGLVSKYNLVKGNSKDYNRFIRACTVM
jgi:hypothetical protein